jgi:hypothetical protein
MFVRHASSDLFAGAGIGKTCTSAWLCRQELVREHFSCVLWVALGQCPSLDRCQQLLYTQLAGKQMASDLEEVARRELINQAMRGKDILLVVR